MIQIGADADVRISKAVPSVFDERNLPTQTRSRKASGVYRHIYKISWAFFTEANGVWEWFELLDSRVGMTTLVYKLYHLISLDCEYILYATSLCFRSLQKMNMNSFYSCYSCCYHTHTSLPCQCHESKSQASKSSNHNSLPGHCLDFGILKPHKSLAMRGCGQYSLTHS